MDFEFEDKPKPEDGREKMDQEPTTNNLVDTTDCLEAVGVIRCWKNFLFIIIVLTLLGLQGAFWVMNLGLAKGAEAASSPGAGLVTDVNRTGEEQGVAVVETAAKIKQAAKQVVEDANASVTVAPEQPDKESASAAVGEAKDEAEGKPWFRPGQKHITALVRFLDFVLVPAAILYCLTMLFSLKVSLIGRLGGINHITRAFFLSLVFVVLLMPWQLLFAPVFAGAMFTPAELTDACDANKTIWAYVSFYLRFPGYWLLISLILLFAQIRSMRWTRATLRRLEVV